MLKITIDETEYWDEENEKFFNSEPLDLEFEHSLVSVSKWESKYQRPFLASGTKTSQEAFFYIEAMVTTPGFDPDVLKRLSQRNIDEIQEYLESSQTATTFGKLPERRGRGEIITAELIYYWMIAFQIPFECQHWHLNRLFALIQVCNIKNMPAKERSRMDLAREYRDLNAQRRAKLGTSG